MWRTLVFAAAVVLVLGLSANVTSAAALIGHWKFDGNLNDSAGSANGTFAGGQPTYVTGQVGQAVSFDGTDDFVNVASPANPTVYTIALWVRPARTDAASIIARTDSAGPTTDWSHQLRIQNGVFHHYLWVGAERNVPGTTAVVPDTWYHVVIVARDNGPMRLYVNGQEEGTSMDTAGVLWGSGDRIHIGSNSGHAMGWFQGLVDDVRIYNRELTPGQIADLVNGVTPRFVKAERPVPADGAIGVTNPLLQWSTGETALFHDVYFSTNPEPTAADLVAARQPFTMYWHIPGLQPGVTYYWRVDEIEADMVTVHPGDVWSFTAMPLTAFVPGPADGGAGAAQAPTLNWLAGQGALEHHVYLGDDVDAVTNGTAETDKGSVAETTFAAGLLRAGTTYYWRVDETDGAAETHVGDVWSFTTGNPAEGKVLRQWWLGISGTAVNALTSDPRYPNNPSGSEFVDLFEGPVDWADNYGSRLSGWLIPPESGDYTFWIASDDGGELWLSTDADPANGVLIANVPGYTSARDFDNTGGTGDADAQKSDPVTLQAGTMYYLEALVKEGGGGDNIAVAWQAEGGTREVIPGAFVNTYALPPLKAATPSPQNGAVDTLQAPILSWFAGENATRHDVYFGDDAEVVTGADTSSPEYKGRQAGTTHNPGALEWGKTYFWRVDEEEADGTILKGTLWRFTTANFLAVEDFERYDDDMEAGTAIFQTWIDGWDNGTGSTVGYLAAIGGTFGERTIVHGGRQSMPLDYNNVNAPHYSETEQTFTPPENWTVDAVDTLTLYVRGQVGNDPNQPLYVALADSAGHTAVAASSDPAILTATMWTRWDIPLSEFAGVNLAAVKTMYIGVGDRDAPTPGGAGLIFVDDIRVTKPEVAVE